MAEEVRPDRISVGMGFKRNLKNYQSMDIHISYSSDALGDEDADALLRRVYDFVGDRYIEEFKKTEGEIQKVIKKEK